MNNKIILGLVAFVIVAGGIFLFLSSDDEASITQTNQSQQTEENGDSIVSNSPIEEYLADAKDGGTMDMTGQAEVSASIGDFVFEPTRLTVSTGTTVTWTNDDNIRHNVVSWDESPMMGLDAPLLSQGETYSFTFDAPGEYVYFCSPHPFQMRGLVTVVEG